MCQSGVITDSGESSFGGEEGRRGAFLKHLPGNHSSQARREPPTDRKGHQGLNAVEKQGEWI